MRLDGRVAIVTGAGHGLGRAYAHRLVADGARVAALDIDAEAAADVATETGAAAFAVDVTDAAGVGRAVQAVAERWGRVDALINNAGGALLPTAAFDTFSPAEWTRVLEVNLTGAWVCAAAVAPLMRAAHYGKIINVTSTTAQLGRPLGLAPYNAAKAGIVGLTRTLARELGPHGVCVNAVAPGYIPVDTVKAVRTADAAADLRQRMIDEQCLPQTGTPDDLAGVIAFLCSSDSDFISGQVLNVDGGWAFG